MAIVPLAFFGDVVGAPGRSVFSRAVKELKAKHSGLRVVVNGENCKNGSGLHPEGYRDLRAAGADAITLGDHCFKDTRIWPYLDDPKEPVARPANLAAGAKGKLFSRVSLGDAANGGKPGLYVVTVLGRLFMSLPANDPFATVDRVVSEIEAAEGGGDSALVLVEIHAEASSEKIAMAWHCLRRWPRRVIAVVGTHTHVQTADARLLEQRMAAMTDVGFCGGHGGVIGRTWESVLHVMTVQNPVSMEVCDTEPQADGCVILIDTEARAARGIEPFQFR
ncbi:MAG TPA: TIGR00282 family metallophosphoesterase [Phycisphaerales bacterium]|nr:TIGR00282 family metallophosphoesterase [Phycisphaerales bacterium]